MRNHIDNNMIEDESAGYLISVSDMMSGLLFIFIITLVAFIINFQDAIQRQEEKRQRYEDQAVELKIKNTNLEEERRRQERSRIAYTSTVEEIVGAKSMRRDLLVEIRERLLARGIKVQIDSDHGVLRLTEKAIRFKTGKAELKEGQLNKINVIGSILADILPCYSANPPASWLKRGKCDELTQGKLDSVFVEGHTDNVPVTETKWGRFRDNWELSALRAIYTYQHLISPSQLLMSMLNQNNMPVFSVSGYGDGRPLQGHDYNEPTPDIENRRIDLRFLMTPPSQTEAEKALKEAGVR